MKQTFCFLLLTMNMIGFAVAQQSKTVEIPGDAYTAYNIPEGGSALQLNIQRANTNLVLDDSEIQLQDTSDTVQWYRSSASQATHVYQIGTVLSAREYLHVFGHWHYLGPGGGGGGTPPTFNARVAAPDIDLESLNEEQEESTGVWIAKAGTRKPVTVRAVQCKGANNQQTLTWSSAKISLWTAASGGNPLSSGTTLAADQDQTRYAQGDIASGSIRDSEIKTAYTVSGQTAYDKVKLTVVGATISSFSTVLVNATNDVSVTLSPNPPGITNTLQISCLSGSGSAQFEPSGGTTLNIGQSGTVKIKGLTASSVASNMIIKMMMGADVLASNVFTVMNVEVTELSFTNDYGIYNITDPVWKKQNNPDNPACYQKDHSLTMNVKLAITPSLPSPVTISLKADGPGNLDAQKDNISISGSETTVNGITTSGKLENQIYSTTPSFNWSFSTDGTTWGSAGTSGSHKLYAIYGSPTCGDANFTVSNIVNAVGKATGESTETGIASKANDNVGANVYEGCICSDGFQKNFDAAMGNYPASGDRGMCCCRAEGLDCVLNVLGIGPYTHDYVNELAEPNFTAETPPDQYCTNCVKQCYRRYWDGFWNNWEGVVKAGGAGSTCYAPANGSISIDEGTYSQIDSAIAADCGYYWKWGDNFGDTCPHLPVP